MHYTSLKAELHDSSTTKLQSTRPGFLIVTGRKRYVIAFQANHVLDVLDYGYLDQRMSDDSVMLIGAPWKLQKEVLEGSTP
jgi:hypothetical protein